MNDEISTLPLGWAHSTVGEVSTEIISGSGFPKEYQGAIEGDYPFAKVGDISRLFRSGAKTIGTANHYISAKIREAIKARVFPPKTIVFPKIGEALKGNYRLITAREMIFDNNVMGIVTNDKIIECDYLFYFLITQDFGRFAVATAVPSVRKGDVASVEFLLPPLKQQRRIVAKVEELFSELDKGVENLKTAREQLKAYRHAVLKHAFEGKLTAQWRRKHEDKLESASQLVARIKNEREARYQQQLADWKASVKKWNANGQKGKKPSKPRTPDTVAVDNVQLPDSPKEWIWLPVGNLNADIFDGPFGSNLKTSDYVEDGVRVIRLENIGYLEFLDGKHSYVTVEKYESIKKHTVRSGDIIFSSFVTDGIRVVVLPRTVTRAVNKADCFCLRLCGDAVRNDFIASFLSSRSAYKQIKSEVHGIGRPRINTTQLKGFAVPVCSREEQDEIMARLREKWSLADSIEAMINSEIVRCETLRQSIMKSAFLGRLVSQDPNDEPASVLLERIKAEKAEQNKDNKNKNNKMRDAA